MTNTRWEYHILSGRLERHVFAVAPNANMVRQYIPRPIKQILPAANIQKMIAQKKPKKQ